MIYLRKAHQRGHANHGWLDSWHTFSFADYYDPDFMGFSALRVINEDRIDAGQGFGTHPHRDMEILTYVLEGTVEHQDSMGNKEQIHTGEFQIMSAGTGIRHSEYNASQDTLLHLYQIWIIPEKTGLTPRYEQRRFDAPQGRQLVLSPDARDGSLKIFQDMTLWRWPLKSQEQSVYQIQAGRQIWIQVVRGTIEINGHQATTSDALAIKDETALSIHAGEDSEILLFDLPPV
ncbi:pirin family protein [Pectobacteriaceae bacterium CE70]|uniref:Pirin family protein n=1 Tax=Serratia sp. (strain ATCC 39006) TaxID=104623 RepID=A0A2I5TFR5_SERS3|nr:MULTISPECIES: pirin family protein [Enterobacterales]WJV62310.1 pirin family protein [Pectobacteriaceae bacterium C52]WJV66612.1 pirin family protein [Pectobacteriaceae bacterium CE70]WJY10613.1 pirin family protein [Pectobacteriaceae bacterium C80]AUG99085.1 pirin family protein [Serratia sp. ATCC 39006]AUH03401.1 pirin family protein [Serratia sp. ATCC 39006]